ncbi:hypothetical protein LUZ60_004440 [Juncus effusus]|nr:hypothetical protein LUZ60_004440 [Juncus effusus]
MATRSLFLLRRRTSLIFSQNFWSLCKDAASSSPSCYDFHYNFYNRKSLFNSYFNVHRSRPFSTTGEDFANKPSEINEIKISMGENENAEKPKLKRKKLKGKREVIKWLKHFRYKKKKEFERMTAEEKILHKLKLARMREERFINALRKIEPNDPKELTHDPEILTPEEHFYYLKMGLKCKNYVPVGRRGIFQGVILNMHLHWKKHQTLKVIVKTFTKEEVKEIAAELARLSGGIVLQIIEDRNEIIMYRGKNYVQPPTEIMSPKVTLSRKKAMDKSKYLEKLRMVHRFIPRLEQELEDLHLKMKSHKEFQIQIDPNSNSNSNPQIQTATKPPSNSEKKESFEEFETQEFKNNGLKDNNFDSDFESDSQNVEFSESEELSDIFETDLEEEKGEMESPVFLDILERFSPAEDREEEQESFEEHLRKIADVAKRDDFSRREINVSELDEIDRIFLSASSLLKKKR